MYEFCDVGPEQCQLLPMRDSHREHQSLHLLTYGARGAAKQCRGQRAQNMGDCKVKPHTSGCLSMLFIISVQVFKEFVLGEKKMLLRIPASDLF